MGFCPPKCIVALSDEVLTCAGRWELNEGIDLAGQGKLVNDTEQGTRGGHDRIVQGVAGIGVGERGLGSRTGGVTDTGDE